MVFLLGDKVNYLAGRLPRNRPNMTKKGSFFKLLQDYFHENLWAGIGWLWILGMPALGSAWLAYSYQELEAIPLTQLSEQIFLTGMISVTLGLALLPTTLTSLACGFFWGWIGFPPLFIGYALANVIGYFIGKHFNSGFFDRFYNSYPEIGRQIQAKINQPGQLIFFIRISPVIPFAVSNFLFASLQVPLGKILLYGIPGMLPRTFLAFGIGLVANTFLGAKEALSSPSQLLILVSLFALSVWGIYRQIKQKNA